MRFSALFLIASNLFVGTGVWFYCQPAADVIVEVKPDPVVDVKPAQKDMILEYQTTRGCSPCIKFKNSGIIEELEAKGWTVVKTTGIGRAYPGFRVWSNGKSKVWYGFSSKKYFFTKLNSVLRTIE